MVVAGRIENGAASVAILDKRLQCELDCKKKACAIFRTTHSLTNLELQSDAPQDGEGPQKYRLDKVVRLIERNNFESERNFSRSQLQKLWNWKYSLYKVLWPPCTL